MVQRSVLCYRLLGTHKLIGSESEGILRAKKNVLKSIFCGSWHAS